MAASDSPNDLNLTSHLDEEQRAAAKRVIFLTVFLDLLGFGIVLPQLGVYASQFGATPFVVGILASIYSAMSFLSTPFWGRLSDRIGRRPVMLYSIFGTAIGYIVFGFAGSIGMLFLSRFIDGITAGNISTAQAYLTDITPAEERSKTFGMFGATFGIGFAMGPMIGALLTHLPGIWGGNFGLGLFTAALGFINLAMAFKRLPETLSPEIRQSNQEKHSDQGRQLLNIRGFKRAFALPGLNLLMAISFVATVAFATLQGTYTLFLIKQYVRPEVQTRIVRNPQEALQQAKRESAVTPSKGSEHIVGGGEEGHSVETGGEFEPYPPSLGGDFDLKGQTAEDEFPWRRVEKILVRPRAAQLAAWIFASIGIVSLIVQGGMIGPLKKRFGEANLIIAGTILMVFGLALVPIPKHIFGEFPVMGLLAFGNSIATPVLMAMASELAPARERGEMLGVFQSVSSLGRIIGPNIGGVLFNTISAAAPYFVGSGIMLIPFGLAFVLRNQLAKSHPEIVEPQAEPSPT